MRTYQCKNLGSSQKVAKRVARERFECRTTFSSCVAQLQIQPEKRFVLGSTAVQDVRKQQMEQNAGVAFISVQSAMECMESKSTSPVDSTSSKPMVKALQVIHRIDVSRAKSIFLVIIFQNQLLQVIHAESVLETAT